MDPVQNEDPETIHLRKQILEIIQSIDPERKT